MCVQPSLLWLQTPLHAVSARSAANNALLPPLVLAPLDFVFSLLSFRRLPFLVPFPNASSRVFFWIIQSTWRHGSCLERTCILPATTGFSCCENLKRHSAATGWRRMRHARLLSCPPKGPRVVHACTMHACARGTAATCWRRHLGNPGLGGCPSSRCRFSW